MGGEMRTGDLDYAISGAMLEKQDNQAIHTDGGNLDNQAILTDGRQP